MVWRYFHLTIRKSVAVEMYKPFSPGSHYCYYTYIGVHSGGIGEMSFQYITLDIPAGKSPNN